MANVNKKNLFDVVIIGSGLSGIICAKSLNLLGLKVCIIEQKEIKQDSKDIDGRALSLSKGTCDFLEKIDLWSQLSKFACPIDFIRVLEDGTENVLDFNIDSELGYIIEAKNMNNTLRNIINTNKSITLKEGQKVLDIINHQDFVEVTIQDEKIQGRLAIVADGRFSSLRKKLGIECQTICYNQTAMIFTVKHELPHNNVAIENFTPTGPFAILPIKGGHHSGVVWIEESDIADYIMTLDKKDRLKLMMRKFGDYLGNVEIVSDFITYPLILKIAKKYYKGRSLLMGDALHGIHPLAGQGLNLAINDIRTLHNLINEHNDLGMDIGSSILLEKFYRLRKCENQQMVYFTHGLNSIFTCKFLPLKYMRRTGMNLLNKMDSLKRFFINKAMAKEL